MNRSLKNIICIIGIIVGILIIFLTKNNINTNEIRNVEQNNRPMAKRVEEKTTEPSVNFDENNKVNEEESVNEKNNEEVIETTPSNDMKENIMPLNNTGLNVLQIILITIGSIILSISLIYLIMSLFGKYNVFISTDRIIIFILLNIILSFIISYSSVKIINNNLRIPNDNMIIKERIRG